MKFTFKAPIKSLAIGKLFRWDDNIYQVVKPFNQSDTSECRNIVTGQRMDFFLSTQVDCFLWQKEEVKG